MQYTACNAHFFPFSENKQNHHPVSPYVHYPPRQRIFSSPEVGSLYQGKAPINIEGQLSCPTHYSVILLEAHASYMIRPKNH